MKKFSTINSKYLLTELRDGFDYVKDDGFEIRIRTREGFKYNDFSQRCKVIAAPEDGMYKVGDIVWVHHFVMDDVYDGTFDGITDGLIYATREENILFKGSSPEDCVRDGITVFKYLKQEQELSDGVITKVKKDDDFSGIVVAGDIPKGTVIKYKLNMELELWHNEEQFLVIDTENIMAVNGEPFMDWYEFDPLDDEKFDFGWGFLTGQVGVQEKLGTYVTKKQKIVKLKNPNLKLDGALAIVQDDWSSKYTKNVIASFQ